MVQDDLCEKNHTGKNFSSDFQERPFEVKSSLKPGADMEQMTAACSSLHR